MLGRLQNERASGGERGRNLQRGHQQRKVPRHDLRRDADGLARYIAEYRAARHRLRLDQLAPQFRCPARHVTQLIDGAGNVDHGRHAHRLAIVDGLELSELGDVRFDQIRKFVDDPLPLVGRQVRPAAVIERGPGGGDGAVNIAIGSVRDARDGPPRGRILHGKGGIAR